MLFRRTAIFASASRLNSSPSQRRQSASPQWGDFLGSIPIPAASPARRSANEVETQSSSPRLRRERKLFPSADRSDQKLVGLDEPQETWSSPFRRNRSPSPDAKVPVAASSPARAKLTAQTMPTDGLRVRRSATEADMLSNYPQLAVCWHRKQNPKTFRNKHRNAHSAPVSCAWKVRWKCQHKDCGWTFTKSVKDFVHSKGKCVRCHRTPPKLSLKDSKAAQRPSSSTKVNLNPMLAYQWEKFEARISDDQRLFLSPKLDGIRCIVHCPEANRNESSGFTPRFVSRQGMELECGDHLAKYFSRMFRKDPNLVFDGELYSDLYKDDFEKITGAARCTRDRRTAEQQEIQENLQYYVFDLMHASSITKTTPFFERLSVLRRVLTEAKIPVTSKSSPIVLVPQLEATKSKIGSEFRRRRDEGYEGLMVRTAESPYMFGKRSPHILKVKEFADSEFKIVGVEEGEGRLKGHLGSFVCEADAPKPKAPTSPLNSKRSASKSSSKIVGEEPSEDTITFRATPKCPESRKREMWEQRDEFIGKMLTVTYQGLSTYGVPRFPIAKAIRGGQSKRDWL